MQGVSFPYKYAIMMGHKMDREEMLYVPHKRGCVEVMKTYRSSSQQANKLAAYIRTLGWQAEAYGIGEDIVLMPMAINAGLGQLGKHGSLISKEYGSNFRLSCVMTDLPMALDAPVDIGVDDLCISCQRCRTDCPPGRHLRQEAMGARREEMVRRFRQVHLLFHAHPWLRDLPGSLPLVGARPGRAVVGKTAGQAQDREGRCRGG